jgi:hypothetical protein
VLNRRMSLGSALGHRLGAVVLLLLGPTAVVVAVGTGPLGAVSALAKPPLARPARTVTLSETAHLHLTSKHSLTLNEQGQASGTIPGSIYIHLRLSNDHGGVSAEVNIYPRGGSLSGYGSATYSVEGAEAVFSGKLAIARGTGSYSHASATGLRFTGSIQRRTDAVAVKLSGPLST